MQANGKQSTFKAALSFLLLVSLSACTGRKAKRIYLPERGMVQPEAIIHLDDDHVAMTDDPLEQDVAVTRVAHADQVHQLEIQLFDIPVPLAGEPVFSQIPLNQTIDRGVLVYHLPMARDVMVGWYKQEMERLGWQRLFAYDAQLLVFEKPDRVCVICSAAQDAQSAECVITLMYGEKEKGNTAL